MNRSEIRFAVLFGVSEDRVDDRIPVAHLNGLEEPLVLAHVLEDVRLQVPIRDENGAPCHVLKRLFEGLDDLLHSLVRRLARQDLKHVLIDHFHFLDVNLLTARAKSAKRRHRVHICVLE